MLELLIHKPQQLGLLIPVALLAGRHWRASEGVAVSLGETLNEIKDTTLSDLILRDTDTTAMQSDAFVATERHSGTLGGVDPTGEEAADGMAQLVVGSAGKDTLTGGDPDDTLVAASGHMTMTGGDGADTFVINLDDIKGNTTPSLSLTSIRRWTSCNS